MLPGGRHRVNAEVMNGAVARGDGS